ncbi:MAG: PAS domain-containing protein [Methylocystaceae bacterium]|nr:PAS domain-containing protein [Methylocystaceae bacterium]
MTVQDQTLTGVELFFDKDDVIVSKTDTKGIITYANSTFAKMAEINRQGAIGKPHNFIRHPHMPRCIFKLLWDTIANGKEIFAYVVNRSVKGNEYWVLAHVTPSFDGSGQIVGYHSNRRVPNREVLETIIQPLYKKLLEIEQDEISPKTGLQKSTEELNRIIEDSGKKYNHFIMTLGE